MKKIMIKIGGIVLVLLIVFGVMMKFAPLILPITLGPQVKYEKPTKREELLYNFINSKLTNENGGIKTNYLNEKSEGIITKGNTTLSESEGFMLLYYLETNNKDGFNNTYKFIKNNMMLDNGLISWRVNESEKNNSTSTIDDLRIIRALLVASEKWDSLDYREDAISLSDSMYKELRVDNLLVDYKGSDLVTLSYVEEGTLKYLSEIEPKWENVYKKSEKIVQDGYIGNSFPLYKEEYNVSLKSYDNLSYVETLNTTIVVLNEIRSGKNEENTIKWFQDTLENKGSIYSKYNIKTGEPIGNIQSTAIYANLIKIARLTNNKELYKLALNKFYDFQVLNKNSEIYGGFGDSKTLSVYSFDNVNALLAFRDLY